MAHVYLPELLDGILAEMVAKEYSIKKVNQHKQNLGESHYALTEKGDLGESAAITFS